MFIDALTGNMPLGNPLWWDALERTLNELAAYASRVKAAERGHADPARVITETNAIIERNMHPVCNARQLNAFKAERARFGARVLARPREALQMLERAHKAEGKSCSEIELPDDEDGSWWDLTVIRFTADYDELGPRVASIMYRTTAVGMMLSECCNPELDTRLAESVRCYDGARARAAWEADERAKRIIQDGQTKAYVKRRVQQHKLYDEWKAMGSPGSFSCYQKQWYLNREAAVYEGRMNGCSYIDLARQYDLSQSRIREIVAKQEHIRLVNMQKMEEEQVHKEREKARAECPPDAAALAKRVDELDISVRAFNCLKNAGIDCIGDLLKYSVDDLKRMGMGRKTVLELQQMLSFMGLSMLGA